ncbi:MAG: hypothetical protein HFH33_05445 [Eubacterium sp.]|nr:hypothetical protein [Eubacterium sp.]
MADRGEYFTINRARQYGKTKTLHVLREFLAKEYEVVSLNFQLFSHANFQNEQAFVTAFSSELLECAKEIPQEVQIKLHLFTNSILCFCRYSERSANGAPYQKSQAF